MSTTRTRFRQVAQLLRIAAQGGFGDFLRSRPRSSTAYLLAAAVRTEAPDVACVLDVGANVGQFARATLTHFPKAKVVSVEANPEAAALAREALVSESRWLLRTTAVGDYVGMVDLRLHAYSPSTSLLPALSTFHQDYGHEPHERIIPVPITTLDILFADEQLPQPLLMKLDVQGVEAAVLRGARATLQRSTYVLIEVSFITAYEGESTFEEVHDILSRAGFRIRGLLDSLRSTGGRVSQADLLYFREAHG